MFTPLVRGDHTWVRELFPRRPGAAVYSDSWLYLTQACRGALGPMGAYYRCGSFFVCLGRHNDHWVLVRPVGEPPDGFLRDLGKFIADEGGSPVVFVKKPNPEFLSAIGRQAGGLGVILHSEGALAWDAHAPSDDDTFPEYVISTKSAAELPHATGRQAQRLRSKLRQCVYMKPERVSLAADGAEAALRRFLTEHFDGEPESISSYDNMIDILTADERGSWSHYLLMDNDRAVVAFFAYEVLDATSVGVYASLVSRSKTGLSERYMIELFEELSGRYSLANLGGSETASLDRYKRKYATQQGRKNPLLALDMRNCASLQKSYGNALAG